LGGLPEQFSSRIGRRERYLDGFAIHFARKAHRLLDGLLAFARQPEDESSMDQDAQLVAVLGEAPRPIQSDPLFDVLEDLGVAAFISDDEQAQAPLLKNFQGLEI